MGGGGGLLWDSLRSTLLIGCESGAADCEPCSLEGQTAILCVCAPAQVCACVYMFVHIHVYMYMNVCVHTCSSCYVVCAFICSPYLACHIYEAGEGRECAFHRPTEWADPAPPVGGIEYS